MSTATQAGVEHRDGEAKPLPVERGTKATKRDAPDERIPRKDRPKGPTYKQALKATRKAARAETQPDAPKDKPKAKRDAIPYTTGCKLRVRLTLDMGALVVPQGQDPDAFVREGLVAAIEQAHHGWFTNAKITRVRVA